MFALVKSIFSGVSPGERKSQFDEAVISAAIERAIDGTDPRLRLIRAYKKKLREPVEHALQYAEELVDSLPPPIEVSRGAFVSDPVVKALFVSSSHLQEVFSRNKTVTEFIDKIESLRTTQIHVLLSMVKEEKTVLGLELGGELIKRDVKQTVVNFFDHRLAAPTATDGETRTQLKDCVFEHLIEAALQEIVSLKLEKHELEKQRTLLRAKLRAMQQGHWGLEKVLEPVQAAQHILATIQEQIDETEQRLLRTSANVETLGDYLEQVAAVLSRPNEYLQVNHTSIVLDRKGIKISEKSQHNGIVLNLEEVHAKDRWRRIVFLAQYPRAEILPQTDLLGTALRYL